MTIRTDVRPQMAVLLRFIMHQIVSRPCFLFVLECNDRLIIFPIAVADHIVIAQIVHFRPIYIHSNKTAIFSVSIKPSMQDHKTLSVRRHHNMVYLMLRTCHLPTRFKGNKICILQNRLYRIIDNIQFPDAWGIRNLLIFCCFLHIRVSIARTKTMQSRKI